MKTPRFLPIVTFPLLLSAGLGLAALSSISAQDTATLTTVYNFKGSSDGEVPNTVVHGTDGNFYGTTGAGGSSGYGTVFKLTAAGTLTTLHAFTGGSDGAVPNGGLIQGSDGNFYGTTSQNGAGNSGTVFCITPAGVLTTLHSFSGRDGDRPYAGLVQGADGNFYGTTDSGGTLYGGTVFQVTPAGGFTLLHSFGNDATSATYSNGYFLDAGLTLGNDGNLYGTTTAGGNHGAGTFFQITPAGVLTTLAALPSEFNGTSASTLTQGSDGDFYGAAGGFNENGYGGRVFKITPTGVLTDLYTLVGDDSQYVSINSGLLQASDGKLYGLTGLDGTKNEGSAYQITTDGAFTSLFNFTGGKDGAQPGVTSPYNSTAGAGLVQAGDGAFYGTTAGGGSNKSGTIFKLTITKHPDFFAGQQPLDNGVYYLAFASGSVFGYYAYLSDSHYLYHFDLGYEYVFDAADAMAGVYLYDFESRSFFYTSPSFGFPYLYDFTLNTVLYYYPDPNNSGRYNTNGVRYFYRFDTGQIITK